MQRIWTLLCDQLVGFHAHHDIGGFDADHQIIIPHLLNHPHLIQRALYDSFGRHCTIFFQKCFFQGTAVDADPDGNLMLLRLIDDGPQALLSTDIARIDPNLVGSVLNGRNRHPIVKMDIRHQRDLNIFFDLPQCLSRFQCGNGTAHDLTACRLQPVDLLYGSFDILGLCIGHRLDRHRMISSDHHVSDPDFLCVLSQHVLLSPFRYLIKQP